MKIIIPVLLACVFFFSCSDKKNDKSPAVSDIPRNDSSANIIPEKTINSYSPVDISPMDMSYYPADYPKLKMTGSTVAPPLARVVYSRPHLQGRKLFHEVLKYGEPWRLGANEATELDLYSDATIQNKKVKAGRYILYCIPEKDKWTIVLNSNIDSWGLQPDASKDIARFIVPVKQTNSSLEFFTMIFQPATAGANLIMAWDNIEAMLHFAF